MNEEANLPTWFSAAFIAAAAIGCFVLARSDRPDRRLGWRVAGWVVLAASIDEVAQIHERTGKIVGGDGDSGVSVFAWLIPGGIVMVALLVGLVRFTKRLDRRVAVRLLVAAGLFFAGAVGIEAVGGAEAIVGEHNGETLGAVELGRPYLATTALEETLEFVGEVMMILTVAGEVVRTLGGPDGTIVVGAGRSDRSPSTVPTEVTDSSSVTGR